jgi:hypothetical protein
VFSFFLKRDKFQYCDVRKYLLKFLDKEPVTYVENEKLSICLKPGIPSFLVAYLVTDFPFIFITVLVKILLHDHVRCKATAR